MTTTICVLLFGALAFQGLTPGMISIAPGVADAMARTNSINAFPLGQTMGGMWYGVFEAGASAWLMSATIAGLVMIGSVFAAFAGVLADPAQVRLGIHRRRLYRLLDTLEVDFLGGKTNSLSRESISMRDFWISGMPPRAYSAFSGTDAPQLARHGRLTGNPLQPS